MSVDLLRQLDAYGDHIEASIDHVDAGEATERALLARADSRTTRTLWRRPLVQGVAGVAVLVLVVAGLSQLGGGPIDSNFNDVGDALGSEDAALRPATASSGRNTGERQRPATTAAAEATTAAPAEVQEPDIDAADVPLSGETSQPTAPDAAAGRDIVFVGTLSVSVSDAEDATERAILAVESLGGFLSGERSTGGADAESVLTFKVPPDRFQDVLDRLGDIGVVTDREVTADDVTEVVVDLQSQIATAEVSVERLRVFLAEATNVNDVAKLERELTNREGDLERLRGQLATLENRVALATIRVTFTEAIQTPKVRLATGAYESKDDEGATCMGARPATIAAGLDATVCIEITNDGKTELTDVRFDGPALDLFTSDFVAVEGDVDAVLRPGDVVLLAGDVTVTERIRADLVVTAVPINESGDPVVDRAVRSGSRISIDIRDPDELPGFGDAWSRGVSVLRTTGSIMLIVLGAVLPWVWLPALIALIVWWRRRR